MYVDDLNDLPELAGAAHVVYVRSTVAHGTITSIDTDDAAGMPGVLAVYTAADLGLRAGPVAVQPDGRPHAARQRQGALRRRARRRRRRRDPRAGHRRRRDRVRRLRRPPGARRHRGRADRVDAHLRGRRQQRRVRLDRARHARELTGRRVLRRLRGHGHRPVRQPARRAVPARGARRRRAAWIDGRLNQWVSTQHAAGRQGRLRRQRTASRPTRSASSRPTSAAASAPRSARTPRRCCSAGCAKRVGRPVRWIETRTEIMMSLGHGRAQVQYVTIGGTRDGKITHYRLARRSRTPAPTRAWARSSPVHDPHDGVRRLRHPQRRVSHARRSSPTPRRPSPTAAPVGPRRPPPSSGRSTCSPPRSAWTRPRCAGRT